MKPRPERVGALIHKLKEVAESLQAVANVAESLASDEPNDWARRCLRALVATCRSSSGSLSAIGGQLHRLLPEHENGTHQPISDT